jgi:hypothetical protein
MQCNSANNKYNLYTDTPCSDIQDCTVDFENNDLTNDENILYCSMQQANGCTLINEQECKDFCAEIEKKTIETPTYCTTFSTTTDFCKIPENTQLWQCDSNLPKECKVSEPPDECYYLINNTKPPTEENTSENTNNFILFFIIFIIIIIIIILIIVFIKKKPKNTP